MNSLSFFAVVAVWSMAITPPAGGGDPTVRIVTSLGDIVVQLDSAAAPVTVENFLRYVEGDFYTGGRFHRVVRADNQADQEHRIDVIQAGINPQRREESFAPILLERTNRTGLAHLAGTISMARGPPDSARSDFFICVEDEPELDYGGRRNPDGQGFAAFGRVVEGMDVVRLIHAAPAESQSLSPPIRIERIERL